MTTLREKLGRRDPISCEDLEKQYALQSDPEGFFFMNKATYEINEIQRRFWPVGFCSPLFSYIYPRMPRPIPLSFEFHGHP